LGLCDAPEVVAAGKRALDEFGAGTGSVRFICGTFTIHRELEQALAQFVGCESSLTYVSCWNANEGLVPTLLGEQDIVISDQLNHASIIDSIRLAKAITKCQTAVYKHSDMADLEERLTSAPGEGGTGGASEGRGGKPAPRDFHRRHLLDGGGHRQAPRHPGLGPEVRR